MDAAIALGLALLAGAYLLRRALRTFADPARSACGGGDCGSDCAPAPELVQVQLNRKP